MELNTTKPVYGVYFICCMTSYIEIVKEQLDLLIKSGLYNDSKKIIIFIGLYDNNDMLMNIIKSYDISSKFIILTTRSNLYEKFAINNYKTYIEDNDYYLYYFHTKGLSKPIDSIFHRIRKILNFYIIDKYKVCIKLLENYDAVGCNLSRYPKMHLSGNFWWSKSTHLNKLDNIGNGYLAPEMYVCTIPNGNYISMSQSVNAGHIAEHITLTDDMILSNISNIPTDNTCHIFLISMC